MYGEKMANDVQIDKLRKPSVACKWGTNARGQNIVQHKLQKKKQKNEKRTKLELD